MLARNCGYYISDSFKVIHYVLDSSKDDTNNTNTTNTNTMDTNTTSTSGGNNTTSADLNFSIYKVSLTSTSIDMNWTQAIDATYYNSNIVLPDSNKPSIFNDKTNNTHSGFQNLGAMKLFGSSIEVIACATAAECHTETKRLEELGAITHNLLEVIDPLKFSRVYQLEEQMGTDLDTNAAGNVMVVGMPSDTRRTVGINPVEDSSTNDPGRQTGAVAVYFFDETKGTWELDAFIKQEILATYPVPAQHDNFGKAVSISANGKIFAVGAWASPLKSYGINNSIEINETNLTDVAGTGAVSIFEKNASNEWHQVAFVKPFHHGDHPEKFAHSVSMNGDGKNIAVGAIDEKSNTKDVGATKNLSGADKSGAVYIY